MWNPPFGDVRHRRRRLSLTALCVLSAVHFVSARAAVKVEGAAGHSRCFARKLDAEVVTYKSAEPAVASLRRLRGGTRRPLPLLTRRAVLSSGFFLGPPFSTGAVTNGTSSVCDISTSSCLRLTFKEKRLGMELRDAARGTVQIISVAPGSPAAQLGVPPLSFIEAVDGTSVKGFNAGAVSQMLQKAARPVTISVNTDHSHDLRAPRPDDEVEALARARGAETARVSIMESSGATFPETCMRTRESDVVEIDYIGRIAETGSEFDSRKRYTLLLGNGDVVRGLELGLFDMCIGETRLLRVPPALGFGTRGSRAFQVPPGATLEYEAKLRSINQQNDPMIRRQDLPDERRF